MGFIIMGQWWLSFLRWLDGYVGIKKAPKQVELLVFIRRNGNMTFHALAHPLDILNYNVESRARPPPNNHASKRPLSRTLHREERRADTLTSSDRSRHKSYIVVRPSIIMDSQVGMFMAISPYFVNESGMIWSRPTACSRAIMTTTCARPTLSVAGVQTSTARHVDGGDWQLPSNNPSLSSSRCLSSPAPVRWPFVSFQAEAWSVSIQVLNTTTEKRVAHRYILYSKAFRYLSISIAIDTVLPRRTVRQIPNCIDYCGGIRVSHLSIRVHFTLVILGELFVTKDIDFLVLQCPWPRQRL